MIKLKVLEKEHMERIVEERNKMLDVLRTPFMLNTQMQMDYFNNTISNRESKTRYFAGYNDNDFVLMGGIENIIWENKL